jgi:hypothetical protein
MRNDRYQAIPDQAVPTLKLAVILLSFILGNSEADECTGQKMSGLSRLRAMPPTPWMSSAKLRSWHMSAALAVFFGVECRTIVSIVAATIGTIVRQ